MEDYKLEMEKDILLYTIIGDMDLMIMDQFRIYGKYGGTHTNTIINKKINGVLGTKYNKHTTTQVFNYLFKTERTGKIINNKYSTSYKIVGIK